MERTCGGKSCQLCTLNVTLTMGISIEQWRSTIGLFDGLSFRGIHEMNYIKLYLNLLFKTFKL